MEEYIIALLNLGCVGNNAIRLPRAVRFSPSSITPRSTKVLTAFRIAVDVGGCSNPPRNSSAFSSVYVLLSRTTFSNGLHNSSGIGCASNFSYSFLDIK